MAISVGDRLPSATLCRLGADGIETVPLDPILEGRRVVIFGLPGAFTPTCSAAHLPSFMRTAADLRAKGIDEIICISVNDPHVMAAWDKSTGASKAGITMLADADSSFTLAIGMDFSAPAIGFFNRSKRYSMLVEDGVVKVLNEETERGVCELTAGEHMLELL